MKTILSHKLRFASIGVLGLGVVAVILAYQSGATSQEGRQGFTLYSTMTTIMQDGVPRVTGNRIRYQRADGSFKQVTNYTAADGTTTKSDILYGLPNRGVFLVNERDKKVEFLSSLSEKSIALSEEDLHSSHRNIIREDNLMGYRVLVARVGDDSDYTELYHAPSLMGFQIKTVSVSPTATLKIEPTKIVIGNPPPSEIANVPRYPMTYDLFEDKIRTVEERGGSPEAAQRMRETLRAARNASPQ
jgi:hypothetical protein